MNTEMMKRFDELSEIKLQDYTGAGVITGALVSWFVLGTYAHIAKKATASCQQNSNQWHCVKF